MQRFRKIIFWVHLLSGVIAALVILVMSVTGALLAFEPQVVRYAEREMRTVQPPPAGIVSRLGAQELFARLREARPNAKPTGLTLQADASAAATFALGREGVLYMNPYTGDITGEGAKGVRGFFHVVTDWHRWLGLEGGKRAIGKAITGACNAAFLILAITGIYIWWPKQLTWRFLKPVTIFKLRHNTGRARDFNWHNVIGFWSSWVLIILTLTALVISYQWANNLVYKVTGNQPPAPQGPPGGGGAPAPGRGEQDARIEIPANLNQLWARAEQQVGFWKSIALRLPARPGMPVTFSIEEGTSWNPIARSQLTLDPKTTEVTKWEPYAGLNAGRQLRSWVRSTHTGESGGIIGQIIACLASLGGAMLVWTGLSLAWRRFRAWQVRRKLKGAASASGAATSEGLDYQDEALSS